MAINKTATEKKMETDLTGVTVVLEGRKSYGVFNKVFTKGVPTLVSQAEWKYLKTVKNDSGIREFRLADSDEKPNIPVVAKENDGDLTMADLKKAGMTGLVDVEV